MITMWFRLHRLSALPFKVEVEGLAHATLIWNKMVDAGFEPVSAKP